MILETTLKGWPRIIKVHYGYNEGEPPTKDSPGIKAHIEIDNVFSNGINVTSLLTDDEYNLLAAKCEKDFLHNRPDLVNNQD
jgi:hypothetical protein